MELILDELLETYEEEMQEALKALVRIPSVIDMDSAEERAPYGQPLRKALDKVAEIGEELGFEVKDYDGHVVTVCYGDQGQEVGVLSHVDIVPAGCGWNTDPFDPVVMDGKMFGRGTIDDKGPMVAVLYAMKAIKESKLPIRNHVKHIIGCDEETDHRCVRYYFSKEKSPDFGFSPDASFSVIHGEKAIIWFKIIKEWDEMDQSGLHIQKIEAGTAVNAVPNMARVWLNDEHGYERELQYAGVSAHAMQPWAGENAIVKMVEDLKKMKFSEPQINEYLNVIYDLFEGGCEGHGFGIACEDQLSGKLSLNLGMMKMDHLKSELTVDIRCPIHVNPETVWKTVNLVCQKYGLKAERIMYDPALYVPKDAELVQKLLAVYNESTGRNDEPITIGGGTYCRNAENLVSFGPLFPGEPELAHEPNEYIQLDNMMMAAKIYAQAIYELLK